MKISPKLTLLSAAVFGLTACASSQEQATYVAPQQVGTTASVVTDHDYISEVERIARRRGIGVHCVNAPTKRVAQE